MIRSIAALVVGFALFCANAHAACSGVGTCALMDNGIPSSPQLGAAINVLSLGANPSTSGTGAANQASIINSAFSKTIPGSSAPPNVYLPAGSYHVTNSINVPPGQCLVGDGWQTIIDVDMDFSPSANGIIIVTPTSNTADVKPCIKNLQIYEHLPPDITATASAASSGASSITVSGATGTIANGMYVYDSTTTAAIPSANGNTPTTVTGVSGGVISITPNLAANVLNGDVIHFANPRSGFAALGTCSTTTGGAPCQYPWAVYNNGAQNMDIDYLFLPNVYNGIYQRGQTFHFGYIQVSAFNIGMDIDSSSNFPQIDDFEFWNFAISQSTSSSTPTILANVFYDGSTIAANIGKTDGLNVGKWQVWTGATKLTSAFTWGLFSQMNLDGNNANLDIAHCSFIQIGDLYSTKSRLSTGTPINLNSSLATCRVSIDNIMTTNTATGLSNITVQAGILQINSGYIWHGIPGASPTDEILVSGGSLEINNTDFDCGNLGTGATYIHQTGGTIKFQNNRFICSPNGGGSVGLSATDSALNIVTGNNWNGFTFANPGSLGIYDNYKVSTNAYISSGTHPTATGTCSVTTQVGGATAGKFTASGACAGGTVILALPTAPTGWHCRASDQSTPTDLMNQTATSTTSATLTGTMANNDIVAFSCIGF